MNTISKVILAVLVVLLVLNILFIILSRYIKQTDKAFSYIKSSKPNKRKNLVIQGGDVDYNQICEILYNVILYPNPDRIHVLPNSTVDVELQPETSEFENRILSMKRFYSGGANTCWLYSYLNLHLALGAELLYKASLDSKIKTYNSGDIASVYLGINDKQIHSISNALKLKHFYEQFYYEHHCLVFPPETLNQIFYEKNKINPHDLKSDDVFGQLYTFTTEDGTSYTTNMTQKELSVDCIPFFIRSSVVGMVINISNYHFFTIVILDGKLVLAIDPLYQHQNRNQTIKTYKINDFIKQNKQNSISFVIIYEITKNYSAFDKYLHNTMIYTDIYTDKRFFENFIVPFIFFIENADDGYFINTGYENIKAHYKIEEDLNKTKDSGNPLAPLFTGALEPKSLYRYRITKLGCLLSSFIEYNEFSNVNTKNKKPYVSIMKHVLLNKLTRISQTDFIPDFVYYVNVSELIKYLDDTTYLSFVLFCLEYIAHTAIKYYPLGLTTNQEYLYNLILRDMLSLVIEEKDFVNGVCQKANLDTPTINYHKNPYLINLEQMDKSAKFEKGKFELNVPYEYANIMSFLSSKVI